LLLNYINQQIENQQDNTTLTRPARITNKISQIANPQQFGLFLSSKLSSFCPPAPELCAAIP
ncbi:MAG: hypothetical protein K1V87_04470, partial [Muribaculum sp.]